MANFTLTSNDVEPLLEGLAILGTDGKAVQDQSGEAQQQMRDQVRPMGDAGE